MNREVKFRIFDTNKNHDQRMVYSTEFTSFYEFFELIAYDKEDEAEQFTNFQDKNGKDIYDGDIIKYDDDLNMVVRWSSVRGSWILSDGCNWEDTYLADHLDKEVVGNITENKSAMSLMR